MHYVRLLFTDDKQMTICIGGGGGVDQVHVVLLRLEQVHMGGADTLRTLEP